MNSSNDNWVQIFDIQDTNRHKKGFTIYKTISMLYARNCPDSVTKVTVWKRYNDFKKLYHNIKAQLKLLKIKDKVPSLPSASYFHRFDENVIQQRRVDILNFLEFIAKYPQLFASDTCLKFFKTSYTPSELMNSKIHSIRSELNLPLDSEYNLIRSSSEDEHTISDTDSISTLNSSIDQLPDPLNNHSAPSTKVTSTNSNSSHDSLSVSITNISVEVLPTSRNPMSYILDASQYITHAIDFEASKKYEEAFNAYKSGIDILLRNVQDDKDTDRKEMVRHKVEKYLLRAEKIYNLHLSNESKTIQNYVLETEETEKETAYQSVSDLYKYKVIKIISSGMLVLHSDSQKLYYIKVIHKTYKFSNDKLILPEKVPYMVKLFNYYNCENALFLVLQYSSGTKLSDYMKSMIGSDNIFNESFCSNTRLFSDNKEVEEDDESDCSSDHSYSDLIYNYTSNKLDKPTAQNKSNSDIENDDLEKLENSLENLNIIDKPHSNLNISSSTNEIDDLLLKSQELITSIHLTLNKSSSLKSLMSAPSDEQIKPHKVTKSRKSSELSEWSLYDDIFTESIVLPIEEVTKWSAQLLLALERLHTVGIICCDLQIKNLLIDESGDLLLTYMCNVSEKYDVAFNSKNNFVVAPELHTFQPISTAVDWWSYGVILYEMLVGMPFKDIHPDGLTSYTLLKIPKYVSVESRSLLKQLLAYEPHERLGYGINGAEDIKTHPFFNSISWDTLAAKSKT